MSLYDEFVPQMTKMLRNLEAWLDEAVANAEERGFDPERLLDSRLAPDMFGLTQQVQAACDAAKFAGARLASVEAPRNEDNETTLAEIRARITFTVGYLEGLERTDFEGADTRILAPSMLRGGTVTGADYLREFALPNFYFHVTTAYAILRNAGVKLGKRKFIGSMNVTPPS